MKKTNKDYQKYKGYYKNYHHKRNSKPKNENLKPELRKCLGNLTHKCLGMFQSEGIGQRICRPCKDTLDWKQGVGTTHNLGRLGF